MATLAIGDQAPAITAKDQQGNTVNLSDFKGKKVILYFYPKDNTPGCTTEACNFRDNYQSLKQDGFEVIGVSTDSEQSHQKFIEKFELPFTLLADEDQKIVNDYGVWAEKNMYGKKYMGTNRTTFVIDEEGKIEHIIKKVDNKNATQQIRDLLAKYVVRIHYICPL
ncbi:thioredoxin-dependent thiol peroxidase [Sphingobacterium sp. 1.A.4]|nr:thioredoxin-dependent thiol peroxidase [Sphingobacterium sp. 1.A.4]